jgi:phytoene/squalene synthetase
MKQLFDDVSFKCSKLVTKNYSTSFSLAVYMLSPVRDAIYSIYGFVRFADEIVDSLDTIRKV